MVIEETLTKG